MTQTFNKFGDIANVLPGIISQIVRKAALDVQSHAQVNAPVDTGFLKNSIYTVTSESSSYGSVSSPTKKDSSILPEVEKPEDDQTAYVAVGANYGLFVEAGTRHTPAHPYLSPAVEAVRPTFEEAMSKVEDKLREAGI